MQIAKFIAAGVLALTTPAAPDAHAGPVRAEPLAQLPIVAQPTSASGDSLVVFYSGDGGWAGLDRGLTEGLAHAGVPVVGFDSLRYFWNGKSPDQAAADLAEVLEHYMAAWRRDRVILAGYSFGAGALPPIVARLPPELRSRIRVVALVGVEPYGDLHFHLGSWLDRRSPSAYPLAPILAELRDVPIVCIYGDRDEKATACPTLAPGAVRAIRVSGDHHFAGDYDGLGRTVLKSAGL